MPAAVRIGSAGQLAIEVIASPQDKAEAAAVGLRVSQLGCGAPPRLCPNAFGLADRRACAVRLRLARRLFVDGDGAGAFSAARALSAAGKLTPSVVNAQAPFAARFGPKPQHGLFRSLARHAPMPRRPPMRRCSASQDGPGCRVRSFHGFRGEDDSRRPSLRIAPDNRRETAGADNFSRRKAVADWPTPG